MLASAALVLGLAACSEDDPRAASDDVDESPTSPTTEATEAEPTEPTPSSAATPSPTETPTATAPSPTLTVSEQATPTLSAPTTVDVSARLLPAGRMGKLNAEWTWEAGADFRREPDGLAACHRAGTDVIGADKVAVREYASSLDAGVRAFHLVADFVDEVNARRGYAVLQSWRDTCQQRLEQRSRGGDGVRVTAPEKVRSGADAATSYVVLQPTATGGTRIENVGLSRDGRVIDVVVVRLEGDDFNYPRGRTPAAVGVRNAVQQGG